MLYIVVPFANIQIHVPAFSEMIRQLSITIQIMVSNLLWTRLCYTLLKLLFLYVFHFTLQLGLLKILLLVLQTIQHLIVFSTLWLFCFGWTFCVGCRVYTSQCRSTTNKLLMFNHTTNAIFFKITWKVCSQTTIYVLST